MRSDNHKNSLIFPTPLTRALHIIALLQLVIAWPLYDLLLRYPEFFVARQAEPVDIAFLLCALSLVLPLALVAIQAGAYRLSIRLGNGAFSLIMLLLFLLMGHLVMAKLIPTGHVHLWAVITAVILLLVYLLSQAGRLFVSFLTPAIVIVPAIFLFSGSISTLIWPEQTESLKSEGYSENSPPIIFVVFDEFPSNVLLDKNGMIDSQRFPNFSALSEQSYWYPNATTVATSTVLAIPAILTGRFPDTFKLPHHGEYPESLFTWLGQDYDLNVQEAVSGMCPANICNSQRLPPFKSRWHAMLMDVFAIYLNMTASGLIADLPAINQSWEGFWGTAIQGGTMYEHRLQQLYGFLERIQPTEKPGLDFLHINFPHIPYEYLPSGKRYNDGWLMPGMDYTTNSWTGSELQSRQAYQRFQMQAGAVDTWLGHLLEKLKSNDLYENSLIVLTADHGVSFEPGTGRRDAPPIESLDANILPVPLLIKFPHQKQGSRDPRNAEAIDIMPTIAEILKRPLAWQVDGVSLLGDPKGPEKRAVHEYESMKSHVSSVDKLNKARTTAWVTRHWSPFASTLIGTPITELTSTSDARLRIRFNHPDQFETVELDGDFLPAHANGDIDWPGHTNAVLAIILNGKIAAISRSYLERNKSYFSVMLPESGFQSGRNTVEVAGILTENNDFVLVRGTTSEHQKHYEWDAAKQTIVDSKGLLEADNDGIQGGLNHISRGKDSIEILGWGIDAVNSQALQSILVFAGNKLVWQGKTHMIREETHAYGVIIEVGFVAVIPISRLEDSNANQLRVFAVGDKRRFSEIRLSQP